MISIEAGHPILVSRRREHYNYFRDYDPSVGRYFESDPIGLKGGINTFGYVSDPLTEVDPFGLMGNSAGGMGNKPGQQRVPHDFSPCAYYDKKCLETGCSYYCQAAPLVCRNAQNMHYGYYGPSALNCVRACLVSEDKKRHDERGRRSQCVDGPCLSSDDINSYHATCFETCGVPRWTYPDWVVPYVNPQRK